MHRQINVGYVTFTMKHFKTTKKIHGTLGERKRNRNRDSNRSRTRFSFLPLLCSVRFVVAVGFGNNESVPIKAVQYTIQFMAVVFSRVTSARNFLIGKLYIVGL
jgi:hypothetical protein